MIAIGYFANLLAAVRGQAPRPRAEQNPFYFAFTQGTGRPQPKQTLNYAKLRAFSESPIPRRAIDYIKSQISSLDWGVRVKGGKKPNGRQQREIDIATNVLRMPNGQDSWRAFLDQIVEDILVIGAGAVEKQKWPDNADRPFVLYPVDAASLEIYLQWDGKPTTPRYAQVNNVGKYRDFTPEQIMYIRFNPRTSTPFGLSPLEIAAQTIEYFLAAQSYAARQASLTIPRKMLDLGEEVDQQQVKEYRVYWQSEVEGRGRMPIMGGTKGAKSIDLGAQGDSELFLEYQRFLIRIIAQAFSLDVQKVGEVGGINRSTGDVLDDSTDESAIRPLADTIEAHINREIIQSLGFDDLEFCFRFTTSNQDRKALASVLQILVQTNMVTLDEARTELGYDPLPEGKGQYQLSEFLAIYGQANGVSAPAYGVVQDTGHNMLVESNPAQENSAGQSAAPKEDAPNKGPDR